MIDLIKLETIAENCDPDPLEKFKKWSACWEYAKDKGLSASAVYASRKIMAVAEKSNSNALMAKAEKIKKNTPEITAEYLPYYLRRTGYFQ